MRHLVFAFVTATPGHGKSVRVSQHQVVGRYRRRGETRPATRRSENSCVTTFKLLESNVRGGQLHAGSLSRSRTSRARVLLDRSFGDDADELHSRSVVSEHHNWLSQTSNSRASQLTHTSRWSQCIPSSAGRSGHTGYDSFYPQMQLPLSDTYLGLSFEADIPCSLPWLRWVLSSAALGRP